MIKYFITKFLIFFGNIILSDSFPYIIYEQADYKVNGGHVRDIMKLLKPGDIALRRSNKYLDGHVIPGEFSHAGIYVGNKLIIHSITPCVQLIYVSDFCECDRVNVLRPNLGWFTGWIARHKAIAIAERHLAQKTPYDYVFKFGEGSEVSCSELLYWCYSDYHSQLGWELKTQKFLWLEKEIFAPDDCMTGCVCVYDSEQV